MNGQVGLRGKHASKGGLICHDEVRTVCKHLHQSSLRYVPHLARSTSAFGGRQDHTTFTSGDGESEPPLGRPGDPLRLDRGNLSFASRRTGLVELGPPSIGAGNLTV